MQQRMIGSRVVSAIGLGAMPLSIAGHPDESTAVRTIHAALDAGVTLIDTADAYRPDINDPSGNGHNERIVAKALASWTGDPTTVLVATKAGNVKPFKDDWLVDASPGYLKRACEGSLRALKVETIGLYQLHRPDPQVPIEDSVGALMELQDAGKVAMIGLSNATVDHIERARRTLGARGLASVQNEYSPAVRKRPEVLDHCVRHDISFLPWSPLGGVGNARQLSRLAPFVQAAARHGVSVQQTALAWLLSLGPRVVPIPGARRPESIMDSAKAAILVLSTDEIAAMSRDSGFEPG